MIVLTLILTARRTFTRNSTTHHQGAITMNRFLSLLLAALLSAPAFRAEATYADSLAEIISASTITPATAAPIPAHDVYPEHIPSIVFRDDVGALAFAGADSVAADSLQPAVHRKLLPDNMSFMEKGLWGDSGLMRTIGLASPLSPEVRRHELGIRRTMLTMHQIGGFLTLASMLATVYYGQMSLNSRNTGQLTDPYRDSHENFVAATIGLYGATGMLAILTPPPLIRRGEISTTTIHKTLAWIHVAGMILTPIIGQTILKHGPAGRYADMTQARFHQVSAYVTTAVFAASMIIVTF
jgi:hypothetical protein